MVFFLDAREKMAAEVVVKRYAEFIASLTSLYDAIEGNPEGMKGDAFAPLTLTMLNIDAQVGDKVRQIAKVYKLREGS